MADLQFSRDSKQTSDHRASFQYTAAERNQISFTSISSSESGLDVTNSSTQDIVDAVPLRIRRMPLLGPDYIEQRKASVENLLANRTPDHMSRTSSRSDHTDNGGPRDILKEEFSKTMLPTSNSCDFEIHQDDPYSYLKIKPRSLSQCGDNDATARSGWDDMVNRPHNQTLPLIAPPPFRPRYCSDKHRYERSSPLYEEPHDDFSSQEFEQQDPESDVFSSDRNESDDEDVRGTETDYFAKRQEKPLLKEIIAIERGKAGLKNTNSHTSSFHPTPMCTPPKEHRTASNEFVGDKDNACGCCSARSCCSTIFALFKLKYLCTRFSIWDLVMTFVSISLFLFDVVTDLLLSFTYFVKISGPGDQDQDQDYRFFFILTLSFVVVPSLIVQIFSICWVFDDFCSKKRRLKQLSQNVSACTAAECLGMFLNLVLHVLQMAPLLRYIRAISYGIRSRYYEVKKNESRRGHFEKLWKYEIHDVNFLRLLESFLESAPQLVLQIYIMLKTKRVPLITVVSCIGSLLALSTMMVSFQRAIRNSSKDKKQLSILASCIMFCWRACTISSRVLAFALFLTIQPLAFLGFVVIHWSVATIWIAVKGTNFCTKKVPECLFDAVCGLIYVFCFLNVHETKDSQKPSNRWNMTLFYFFAFVENFGLSIFWYFSRPGGEVGVSNWRELIGGMWQPKDTDTGVALGTPIPKPNAEIGVITDVYALGILLAVFGLFILGIVFMSVYYMMLHPSRTSIGCCSLGESEKKEAFQLVSAPGSFQGLNGSNAARPVLRGVSLSTESNRSPAKDGSTDHEPHSGIDDRQGNHSNEYSQLLEGGDQICSSSASERMQNAQFSEDIHLRLRVTPLPAASEGEKSVDSENASWNRTIFNRGRRARKIYTRQYSSEKILEDGATTEPPPITYDPRHTDRFKATVTPTHEKRVLLGLADQQTEASSKGSAAKMLLKVKDPIPSVVIKPGSHTFQTGGATRSATHQFPLSSAMATPLIGRTLNFHTSSLSHKPACHKPPRIPEPVQDRDYSASMSCLMGGRPLSYIDRRHLALGHNVPRVSSFTISKNEVIESMETSV